MTQVLFQTAKNLLTDSSETEKCHSQHCQKHPLLSLHSTEALNEELSGALIISNALLEAYPNQEIDFLALKRP